MRRVHLTIGLILLLAACKLALPGPKDASSGPVGEAAAESEIAVKPLDRQAESAKANTEKPAGPEARVLRPKPRKVTGATAGASETAASPVASEPAAAEPTAERSQAIG